MLGKSIITITYMLPNSAHCLSKLKKKKRMEAKKGGRLGGKGTKANRQQNKGEGMPPGAQCPRQRQGVSHSPDIHASV
jgi:hypothetical protein